MLTSISILTGELLYHISILIAAKSVNLPVIQLFEMNAHILICIPQTENDYKIIKCASRVEKPAIE